jgi:hypothetical protein
MNSDDDMNIPLVDEINELLTKERTLMGLKVMEHQVEAEEWKKKYETLVQNIGPDGAVDGGNKHAYEIAADIAVMEDKWGRDLERVLYLQHQSDHPWCLDASHIELQTSQLKQIANFPKSHNFNGVSILKLNDCKLKDSDGELVTTLFHFSGIQALDLSHNDLGRDFHQSMMNDIQVCKLLLKLHHFKSKCLAAAGASAVPHAAGQPGAISVQPREHGAPSLGLHLGHRGFPHGHGSSEERQGARQDQDLSSWTARSSGQAGRK